MRKKNAISPEESELFRNTLRGITPFTHTKIIPASPIPPLLKRNIKTTPSVEDPFSDFETLPPVTGEDTICFSRPGLQHKVLRNLKQGKYNAEATLDLHGMTTAETRTALYSFLLHCQKKNIRHVLIIHGKGREDKPILKNKLNHWLRQLDEVLAFCSATAQEGRGGALYVILRRL